MPARQQDAHITACDICKGLFRDESNFTACGSGQIVVLGLVPLHTDDSSPPVAAAPYRRNDLGSHREVPGAAPRERIARRSGYICREAW